MEVLFRQPENDPQGAAVSMESVGILRCFLNRIQPKRDVLHVTRKRHHHTAVELHVIQKGYQVYEVEGERVRVEAGNFLLIPPLSRHRATEEAEGTEKYSLTFALRKGSTAEQGIPLERRCYVGHTPPAVEECLLRIAAEKRERQPYHSVLRCNRVLECILSILRLLTSSVPHEEGETETEDHRLALAKQYIADNVSHPISLGELAAYCHLGEKQLTRIFQRETGLGAAEYVRRERTRYAEQLLSDPALTLSEISERMHFANEYYFNTFFKRCSGMTPGAYRRSVTAKG